MSVGTWEPNQDKDKPEPIEEDMLRRFMVLGGSDQLAVLAGVMEASDKSAGARLMQLSTASWDVAKAFADSEIENLIRFFTLAEMALPGWEAGKKSPVICLVQILKSRDAFSADLRKWIKKNSDNRYLPYGSVL